MRNRIILFLLLLSTVLQAQNPSKVDLKGTIRDSSNTEIAYATVMLLSPKDTTLLNFTRSDDKGNFVFKNVKNTDYLLKISYIGYIPHQQMVRSVASNAQDLGTIVIKPISQALMEVVIRTAKAPLSIRGDTIEYDATTFKVPPGSTVEDLLRRLPGIQVDADGNIKTQGQDVKRVYVDGKSFFGDDPKSATKNLGAETISKVQVYNEKSEQAKLTGVDDGKKEKAINLELKDQYKKGSFGKVTAAVGSSDRWAGRGNFNRFNQKQQLSFIAYGNNINQTGVNWEDYGEFKGQSTFGNYDNGDFGFGGGGGRYYFSSNDDAPLNNFDGRGFTRNFGGGSNYNFDNKKTKFNASYFYNESALTLDQYGLQQNFLPEGSFTNTDTTNKYDFRGNHSVSTRLEQNLDSSDVLIVKANIRLSNSNASTRQAQLFNGGNVQANNSLNINNSNDLNAWRVSSAAIFRHRFKKKGRAFAVSAGYNNNESDGTENLFSINRFFEANDFTEQVRQFNNNVSNNIQYKSSVLYTESFAKKWFLETFYNFSTTNNTVDRQVRNPDQNNERIESLSVYYDNDIQYNRVGSSLRYSNKGLNASVGLAGQQIKISGQYSLDQNTAPTVTPISRRFTNLVPNVDMNYELPNNIWLNAGYNYSVTEPQLSDLQPVPNVNNPAFRSEGNPNLTPELSNSINFNVNHWNPASFASLGIGSNISFFDSRIVYNQTTELIDSIGLRTTTRPSNVSGGNRYDVYLWSNFPIVKTKLTMGVNGNLNGSKAPSLVNGIQNETTNNGFNINIDFNYTPIQQLILSVSGRIGYNLIQNSIQEAQDQQIQNHGIDGSFKWQFAPKFFFESNLNYAIYRNDRFGFNQNIPIWNASVRRLFGKTNRIETRLAAFDLLNRRVSISQYGSQNYVSRNIAATLARYYMVSVSYNLRGYEDKLKKNDWW